MVAAQVSWLQAYLATLATVQVLGLAVIGAIVARRLPPVPPRDQIESPHEGPD